MEWPNISLETLKTGRNETKSRADRSSRVQTILTSNVSSFVLGVTNEEQQKKHPLSAISAAFI